MSPAPASYTHALEQACTQTIGPEASNVDRQGAFPERGLNALSAAGLMGAVSAPEVGGLGLGFRGAAAIVGRLAQECGSTAMVVCMHYCGTAVLEAFGSHDVRRAAASGAHLSTLAFSEAGSRSHFWAPVSTARREGNDVALDARKSWVTSASKATAYVWSSKPVQAERRAEHALARPVRDVRHSRSGPVRWAGAARQRFVTGLGRRRARALTRRCSAKTARASTS